MALPLVSSDYARCNWVAFCTQRARDPATLASMPHSGHRLMELVLLPLILRLRGGRFRFWGLLELAICADFSTPQRCLVSPASSFAGALRWMRLCGCFHARLARTYPAHKLHRRITGTVNRPVNGNVPLINYII